MNLSALLVVPALVLQVPSPKPPPLPSPTPGLGELGNKINFAAITQGTILKRFSAGKHAYTVRGIRNIILLYNHLDHVIAICQVKGEMNFACGETAEDPFPQGGPSKTLTLDGFTYVAKAITMKDGGEVFAVYTGKGTILFAVANPEAVLLPEPPMPL